MFGIGMDKAQALYDDVQLARTGKYKDDWGNEKFVSESDREMLSWMMAIYIPSDFGLIPAPEVASIMRNFVKIAKSDSKTATKIKKEKAYGGYETIKELEENDPELYDELSSDGGALDEYRKEQKEKDEEANKDEPFRGLSEKTFKERYPKEWREQYGPGTAYWKQKNSPEGRREAIEKAKRDKQREIAKAKKKREDAIRKARESRRN
jgi:hypothetical protein